MEHPRNVKKITPCSLRLSLVFFLVAATLSCNLLADPLLIGIFPRRDAVVTTKLFRPLSRYLEEKLQRPV
ncbi:MAG: hypothetical protein KUF80_16240, partial [Candidatus Thiodiazotropha sp. (ex Codakia orbicularis)]|nr:hypothetical protein [Candidatus Thiodiazotropha sp. (ex Codakia orbicularis)]